LRPLHAEFISACSGRIIKLPLGRASFGPAHVAGSGPALIFLKTNSKKFQKSFLKILIFSNIFLPFLYDIGLYIYTVNTKPVLKYPVFSEIFQKKKFETFSKRKKIFCCIRPNPKIFPSIFSIKKQKLHLFHVLKKNPKMDIVTSL
jgi:hypothetical protein